MNKIVADIIWTEIPYIKAAEQILMLRILDAFGLEPFDLQIGELSEKVGFNESFLNRHMFNLKRARWLTWKRTYGEGTGNLKFVTGCRYTVLLKAA